MLTDESSGHFWSYTTLLFFKYYLTDIHKQPQSNHLDLKNRHNLNNSTTLNQLMSILNYNDVSDVGDDCESFRISHLSHLILSVNVT